MHDRPEYLDPDHAVIGVNLADRRLVIDRSNPLWDQYVAASPVAFGAPERDLWSELRAERNRLLLSSDPRMLSDFPQTDAERAAWSAYRIALRQLPDVTTDPLAVVWPEPPQG